MPNNSNSRFLIRRCNEFFSNKLGIVRIINRFSITRVVLAAWLAILLGFFTDETAAANSLQVEVENGTVTIWADGIGKNEFMCVNDASYNFQFPDAMVEIEREIRLRTEQKDNSSIELSRSYGKCEANLVECGLKFEAEKTAKQSLNEAQESLKSCNKQMELFGYEKLGFIALFLVFAAAITFVWKWRKDENNTQSKRNH